jgi:hypothetical protein
MWNHAKEFKRSKFKSLSASILWLNRSCLVLNFEFLRCVHLHTSGLPAHPTMVSTPRRRASTTPRRTQSPRAPRAARTKSPAKAAKTASPASIPANAPATPVAVTSDNHSTAHEPIVYCYDSTKLHDFEQLPRWFVHFV